MAVEHNRFAEIEQLLSRQAVTRSALASPKQDVDVGRSSRTPPRQKFWPWPGLIFVLLGVNISIVGITIFFASTDPSFAVEPDYYKKAMKWDETMAQREHNAALGWKIDMSSSSSGQPIALRLLEKNNQAISGANITMIAFHDAHAHNRLETTLEEIEPGLYRSSEVLTRTGSWQVRLTARIGGETFTATMPHVLTHAGAAK